MSRVTVCEHWKCPCALKYKSLCIPMVLFHSWEALKEKPQDFCILGTNNEPAPFD